MGEYGDLFNAAVAAELRAQRARARVTFDDLADGAGISKSAALNYLNGKRDIPMPIFAEICRTLGVTRREIFDAAERSVEKG